MKVITIATDIENSFLRGLLIPSCNSVGLDLIALNPDISDFRFKHKRLVLSKYLAQQDASDELIVFTDAYDTLFLRGEAYIREVYERFPQKIVFSGEPNCWPLGVIGQALHDGGPVGRFPYLNSGGFIGPARDIFELYAKYPTPPSDRFPLLRQLRAHGYDTDEWCGHSDQYYWTLVQLLEPEVVGVDNGGALFENYGPKVTDVRGPELEKAIDDFLSQGNDSASYRLDRARVEERLQSPSSAAQLHFATLITKSVVLDLYAENQLPAWLCGFRGAQWADGPPVQVEQISLAQAQGEAKHVLGAFKSPVTHRR